MSLNVKINNLTSGEHFEIISNALADGSSLDKSKLIGNTQGFTDFYDFRLLLEGNTPLKELLPEGCY